VADRVYVAVDEPREQHRGAGVGARRRDVDGGARLFAFRGEAQRRAGEPCERAEHPRFGGAARHDESRVVDRHAHDRARRRRRAALDACFLRAHGVREIGRRRVTEERARHGDDAARRAVGGREVRAGDRTIDLELRRDAREERVERGLHAVFFHLRERALQHGVHGDEERIERDDVR
jgi:hypothetical protein